VLSHYKEEKTEHYREGKYLVRVSSYGTKTWLYKGVAHREDGPAIEGSDGSKVWCKNGETHREDGPAWKGPNGHREWYLNDEHYTEDKWTKEMRRRKIMLLGL